MLMRWIWFGRSTWLAMLEKALCLLTFGLRQTVPQKPGCRHLPLLIERQRHLRMALNPTALTADFQIHRFSQIHMNEVAVNSMIASVVQAIDRPAPAPAGANLCARIVDTERLGIRAAAWIQHEGGRATVHPGLCVEQQLQIRSPVE